ncbi:MAG: hypothetical protein HUJ63_01670, partial [Enterococcus sp.]|nr:hypothetical protein [Enterococcus sp.]
MMSPCEQIRFIVKRDGRSAPFNSEKIASAINKAFIASVPESIISNFVKTPIVLEPVTSIS